MRRETLRPDHFEALYEARPDPWHLGDSPYEQSKYAATMQALPRTSYGHGFEIGCANGDLTARLAERCGRLLAVEPVQSALDRARRRLCDRPWVSLARMFVPRDWPSERFDLVVISEVIDYLGEDDVRTLSRSVCGSVDAGGDVILVHWVGKKAGPPFAPDATDLFIATSAGRLDVIRCERNPHYRLDVLRVVS